MAKFKPVRAKAKQQPQIRGGLPCVVIVITGVLAIMVLLFLVMKYAG